MIGLARQLRPLTAVVTLTGLALISLPKPVWASEVQVDLVGSVALALAVVLVAAKVGGELAVRAGQAAVAGELLAGVLLGNLSLAGLGQLQWIVRDSAIDMLARLGILLLVFEVGVAATVGQMLRVGIPALRVALLGVAATLLLGWGVAAILLPQSGHAAVFIAAALAGTSVGVSVRVFQDLRRADHLEARIVLGAAVIDDILALFVMAVVSGLLVAEAGAAPLSYLDVALTLGKASAFLVGGIGLGVWVTPRIFRAGTALRSKGVLLTLSLALCFGMAWAAGLAGLAPIIGAFAAGLVLEDLHSRPYVARGESGLLEMLKPLTGFLAPIFFVVMGMRTDLRAFADPAILGLALCLVAVAIAGKLIAGLGSGQGNRLVIGIGMIPRGEVTLVFANLGLTLTSGGHPLLTPHVFSALVVTVIVTALAAPPALAWAIQIR